jgi:squalene cyclase
MSRGTVLGTLAGAWVLAGLSAARAEDLPPRYRAVAQRGLEWLARQQHRDGHWEASGGNFHTAMTGMAGTVLLMEGSTIREGKYRQNIRRAADFLMSKVQPSGLIGDPNAPNQGLGYLYGHGFSILFLSQVYGEEEESERRARLESILTRAVLFVGHAQTSRGGWGYLSAREGNDFDEGSVTVTQIQALRAARNAGIVVPKQIIDKTLEYLKKCTTERGGMIYSLANGGGPERPTITVAAIATAFSTGEYNSPLAKRWLKFVQPQVPISSVGADQFGHSEYTHYYYAQVIYCLGEDGYARMFPESRPEERLTWSKYRKEFFEFLANKQNKDGSWTGTPVGQVYTTCCYLTVLQLDNGALPIYQR